MKQPERLRKKTGCLTCRSRRVKCREEKPLCRNCVNSKRVCVWPEAHELQDRRFRSHHSFRNARANSSVQITSSNAEIDAISSHQPLEGAIWPQLSIKSCALTAATTRLDTESAMVRHFFAKQHPWMIHSRSHPGFRRAWNSRLSKLSSRFEGLRHGLVANGASHLFAITRDPKLHEVSMTYYSSAISKVSVALGRGATQTDEFSDALMLSVIYLYIHGFWGLGTFADLPQHVAGATELLKHRTARVSMSEPFDRTLVESVLFQMFRVSALMPYSYNVEPNFQFWLQLENVLTPLTFPNESLEANSPALGVPLRLQRLIVEVTTCIRRARLDNCPDMLLSLRPEMTTWESAVGVGSSTNSTLPKFYDADSSQYYLLATKCYVLAASLLLEQNVQSFNTEQAEASNDKYKNVPAWQLREAMPILRNPKFKEQWAESFIGSWPALVFGQYATAEEDISLIREDLNKRWSNLHCYEVLYVLKELEALWKSSNVGQTEGSTLITTTNPLLWTVSH